MGCERYDQISPVVQVAHAALDVSLSVWVRDTGLCVSTAALAQASLAGVNTTVK